MTLDYTNQGRRPSVAQIISDWKKADRPRSFSVTYGETYAEFQYNTYKWLDNGNGCRGVNRSAVIQALTKELAK